MHYLMKEFEVNIRKEILNFGMPWEAQFGYAQAVRVADTIYVSGQLSHDAEGNIVAPGPVPIGGKPRDYSNMEAQIRQTYSNLARILSHFKAVPDQVVEEVLYVLDMDSAFAGAIPVRRQFYGVEIPKVASTLVCTPRLAFPTQLVEIKFVVRVLT